MMTRIGSVVRAWGAAAVLVAVAAPVGASCYPMAGITPRIVPASFGAIAAVPRNHVRIDFLGHASFEIESPDGARIVTDYNGYLSAARVPHIATMNTQSQSHSTDIVDPGVKHVLRGWNPAGGIARHNLRFKDVRVRNVPTNLQDWSGARSNDSSMFVFEVSDLCIVHLGNLRHVLTRDYIAELGRIDIVLAPIDGMWTMSHEELFEALTRIAPALIIPMQFGSGGGIEAFVARASKQWPVRRHPESWIQLSFRDLPRKTEVLFLKGSY
jgi:L-ascorbate metabolism protein UlaG (beta-lactamase superfamily)